MSDQIKIKNRSRGTVVYKVDLEDRPVPVRREFSPGEIKTVPKRELETLSYQMGGMALLQDYLQIIDNDEVAREIGIHLEPEYHFNADQIKELLLTGSQDAFLDCLDFAPAGVLELVKEYAVKLPVESTAKREAIKEKLRFDVDKALALKKAENESSIQPVEEEKRRRVVETATPGRRVPTDAAAPSKYKVVTPKN